MKVFISWSGPLSQAVAVAFHEWLPLVIQQAEPYLSSKDIEKGARWEYELNQELESSDVGIVCLTPDNVTAPWLNFEAGALAKKLEKARVIPFLFGMRRSDVPNSSPLIQFQSVVDDRPEVLSMVETINAASAKPIDPHRLPEVFDALWPRLETQLGGIAKDAAQEPKEAPRAADEIELLSEILEIVRSQQREVASLRSEVGESQGFIAPAQLQRLLVSLTPPEKAIRSSILSMLALPGSDFEDFARRRGGQLADLLRTNLGRDPSLDEIKSAYSVLVSGFASQLIADYLSQSKVVDRAGNVVQVPVVGQVS